MAEIKVEQRQVAQPTAPDLSRAAESYGVVGAAIQSAAQKVGDVVDAYNQLEANAHYSEVLNTLNKELVNSLSSENIAQGNAYERYIQQAEAIIEGGLQHTPRRYKKQYAQDLREKVNKLGLSIAKADLTFREQAAKAEGQVMLNTQINEYMESLQSGDGESAITERNNIDNTITNLKNIGAFDALDEYELKEKIRKASIQTEYTSKFGQILRDDPVEADKLLNELAQNKPSDLSHEDWRNVQAALLQERASYYKMVDSAQTLGMDEFQLSFDSGQIKDINQLNNFISQKESEGRFFSYNDKLKMQDVLIRSLKQESKNAEKILAIDNDIATGSDNIYNYSTADLNAYYSEKSKFMMDEIKEKQALNPDLPAPSPLAIKASIAAKIPKKIEAFTREFNDKLVYGTEEDFEEALTVGSQLYQVSSKTFGYLDKETQAYQQYAAGLKATTSLSMENIKIAANKAIYEKDSETKQKIDDQLKVIHKGSTIKDLYKEIYGTKFVNPALQPQYNNVAETFDSFYRISGDKSIAHDLTQKYIRTRSGTSKYVPKNDITKDPLEETPLFRNHPTLAKNQMALAALEVVKNNENARKAGLNLSQKIEWPDDVPRPDLATLTEKDLYDKPIFEKRPTSAGIPLPGVKEIEPTLKIDGKNRKLFFMNPNTDLEDPSVDQREIWYEDEFGLAQPLFVVKPVKQGDMIKMDSGIPSVQFKPVESITPQMAAIYENRKLEEIATRHLKEEFTKKRQEMESENIAKIQAGQSKGPYYAPRPNPIEELKRQSAIQREEQKYIKENLATKMGELSKSQKAKIDKLIGGEQ
jgi:hypothetical protein